VVLFLLPERAQSGVCVLSFPFLFHPCPTERVLRGFFRGSSSYRTLANLLPAVPGHLLPQTRFASRPASHWNFRLTNVSSLHGGGYFALTRTSPHSSLPPQFFLLRSCGFRFCSRTYRLSILNPPFPRGAPLVRGYSSFYLFGKKYPALL